VLADLSDRPDSDRDLHSAPRAPRALGARAVARSRPVVLCFWNAQGLCRHSKQPTDFMAERHIDLFGISETWITGGLTPSDAKGVQWITGPERPPVGNRSLVRGGVGVFVDRSIRTVTVRQCEYSVWVQMQVQGARPLFIGTVYAPQYERANSPARQRMWEELSSAVTDFRARGVCVIGGDFNSRTGSNGDTVRNNAGTELTEFCERMRFAVANAMPCAKGEFSFSAQPSADRNPTHTCTRRSTIDYVLIDADSSSLVSSFEIVTDWSALSDHRPILISLASCPVAAPARARSHLRQWKRATENSGFATALIDAMSGWRKKRDYLMSAASLAAQPSAAIAVNRIASALHESVIGVLQRTVGEAAPKPALSSLFSFSSAEYDRLVARHQRSGAALQRATHARDTARISMCRAQHIALGAERRVLARRKVAEQRARVFRRVEAASKDSLKFWREHGALFRRSGAHVPLPDSVLRNGQAVSEPEQVMECWRNAFLTLYQPAAPTDPAALEFQQRVDASLRVPFSDLSSDFCGAPLTGLECAITEDEVSAAIRHMCSAAAPGPDSVPAWVFKDGAEAMVPALTVLFNDVWEHRVWPSDWTLGWICPIFKKGARSDPDHYRGITLLPHYDKLLKSVMRTRLSAVIESRRLLSPFQAGFRAEYGTMDHVLTLNEIATSYYERDAPLFLAFLDVSKAYDHTARNLLWYRLRKIGVTDKVLAVWRSSYDNVRRAVRVNEEITCEFACESGVAQGAVDSPTLYDVFIDELSALLLRDGFGVGVGGDVIPLLMYADDIVLLASSAEQLQRMLLVVERFAVQFQFAYNHAKSGVVVVATPALKASFRTHQWMLAGAALPVLDFYKYLGVEFGRMGRGRWNDLLTRLLRGLKGKSTELLWANGNRNGFAPLLQMNVWNALCRPLVEYGCVLWHCSIADDRSDALEVEQLRFAKNTLGVAQSTPTAFVRGELDLPSLASHRDELTLRAFGETMSGSLYPASRDPLSVRLVTRVVRHRMRQARAGQAPMSWCTEVKPLFRAYDLLARWYDSSFGPTKEQWRETCAQAVAKRVRTDWLYAVHSLPTLSLYRLLKSEPAPERYTASLNREGRYLKLQVRGYASTYGPARRTVRCAVPQR